MNFWLTPQTLRKIIPKLHCNVHEDQAIEKYASHYLVNFVCSYTNRGWYYGTQTPTDINMLINIMAAPLKRKVINYSNHCWKILCGQESIIAKNGNAATYRSITDLDTLTNIFHDQIIKGFLRQIWTGSGRSSGSLLKLMPLGCGLSIIIISLTTLRCQGQSK